MQTLNREWLEGIISMLVDLIEEGDQVERDLLRERSVLDERLADTIANRETCSAYLVSARAELASMIAGDHRSSDAGDVAGEDPRHAAVLPSSLFGPM